MDAPQVRQPLDVRALRSGAAPRKPALVVLVMGETARADRFSLNGYERDTNRYTRARGRRQLSPRGFVRHVDRRIRAVHLLGARPSAVSRMPRPWLARASSARCSASASARFGATTARAARTSATSSTSSNAPTGRDADLCDATGCFDELLLQDFDALLADRTRDHFIVLHQRGSHGPAYHTDVPQWAKEFFPECDLPNLRNCDRAAINNSYDNTILYTDYFLSRVIDELEKRSAEFDTAMLYVSDHGESLGENGLYLHGFPYSMAPREQIEVPMLFWASPGFYARTRARRSAMLAPLGAARHEPRRDLSHAVAALRPRVAALRRRLDLLAACRGQMLTAVRHR